MATKILIPTPLRPYTDKKDAVDADGATVGELLADLTRRHGGLKAHLYNDQGKLRSFVNVYVNDEDIRYLQKEQTPVTAADTVSIIPSVAGGVPTETREPTHGVRRAPRHGVPVGPDRSAAADKRRGQALQPPSDHAGGRHGRAAPAEGGQRAVHRRGRPRIARRAVSGGRRRRHASASSTSTSSTSATCSGRSSTARRTWAVRSSRRRRIGSTRSIRTSMSRPTRWRSRRRTR